MKKSRSAIYWRYLRCGKVKHALITTLNAEGHLFFAVCGVSPPLFGNWYGTGSQTEYEQVEKLPECKNCVKFLGREKKT